MNEKDQDFVKKTREQLDASVKSLDGHTRSRLTQIRHKALASRRSRFDWLVNWGKVPAWGAATACLSLIIIWILSNDVASPLTGMEDIDLLASNNSLELYEELDFYAWLNEEGKNAG